MAQISRSKYPQLYWGLRIAIPYNLIGIAFGIMLRYDAFPSFLGETVSTIIIAPFIPISGPVKGYVGDSFWDFMSLTGNMAILFFVSWLICSPLIGMLRGLLGFKN